MKWLLIVLVIALPLILVVVIGALLPEKHMVSRTVLLQRSPDLVWKQITAPPTWRPEVKAYQELPSLNGHRMWTETDAHGQVITYEAIESIPPQSLVVRIADSKLPFGGSWTYVLAPHESGSALTITEKGEVYNPLFRFVSRFIIGHTSTVDAYIKALQKQLG